MTLEEAYLVYSSHHVKVATFSTPKEATSTLHRVSSVSPSLICCYVLDVDAIQIRMLKSYLQCGGNEG